MAEQPNFSARLRPWLPALLWLVVIAWESTDLFTSENTGHWLYAIVTAIFGHVNRRELLAFHAVLRKAGHFVGYAILSYFFLRGWRGRFVTRLNAHGPRAADWLRPWKLRWAVAAVLMTVVVASLDEFHQSMIPGRTGAWHDVVLDGIGGIAAQLLVVAASPLSRRAVEVEEEQKVS
jgi:VanZ family protein